MNKKLILIAEDEVAYGKILQDTLEKQGFEVIIETNGEDFLKTARLHNAALVLLDLIMPKKNGFEVLAEMKKDEKLKDMKVVIVSNLGQDEDIAKAKKLGADGFLVKSDETFANAIAKIKNMVS